LPRDTLDETRPAHIAKAHGERRQTPAAMHTGDDSQLDDARATPSLTLR
jgi:hypothetical protein